MSGTDEFVFGHKERLSGRVNVRTRLKEIRNDPLLRLLEILNSDPILSDDVSQYSAAYQMYYLSQARILPALSLLRRYNNGPKWARRSGSKYTESERRVAEKFNEIAPFLYFDLFNCILHSRILMDRVAGLSHRILTREQRLPSFASFSDHRKFFQKLTAPYGNDEEYACHIRDRTDWFDMPLKHVRDNYITHANPKHMTFLGSSGAGHDIHLTIVVAKGGKDKPMSTVNMVILSPLQLSYNVQEFLSWFCEYGLRKRLAAFS
jgi:hypothetical protein